VRLRKIKEIIDSLIPQIKIEEAVGARTGTANFYKIINLKELQEVVEILGSLNIFEERVELIKNYNLNSSSVDSYYLNESEIKGLRIQLSLLLEEMKNFSQTLAELVHETEPNVISIKIPDPKDFIELRDIANRLNNIFNQTLINDDLNSKIEIVNFDVGSYWIDIIVSNAQALPFIGGLAWSGAVVYKKIQEGRLIASKVKEMNISNSALEEILDKSRETINGTADMEANHLYKAFFKGKDNEQVERIKFALKEIGELYADGGEIHPALNAPEIVKKEFPDFKTIDRIETKIKRLNPSKE
jgi:hypothetical protein